MPLELYWTRILRKMKKKNCFQTKLEKSFLNHFFFFFFLRNKNWGLYGYITPPGREPVPRSAWWGPIQYCVRGPTLTKYAHQRTPAAVGIELRCSARSERTLPTQSSPRWLLNPFGKWLQSILTQINFYYMIYFKIMWFV